MVDVKLGLVCVGGGRGIRFGGDKLAEEIAGRGVFERSLAALAAHDPAAPLVAVCPAEKVPLWQSRLVPVFPHVIVVAGGKRRQDSVRAGVERAAEAGAEVVAIHDAARPLLHPEDVGRTVTALGSNAGVVLCQRVTDTIKQVDDAGAVVATIDRELLRRAQTPQVFRVEALRRAWKELGHQREWTDEAAMLEEIGLTVATVIAAHPNPKLTCFQDLDAMAAICATRRAGPEIEEGPP